MKILAATIMEENGHPQMRHVSALNIVLVSTLILALSTAFDVAAQTNYVFLVGAEGDIGSKGNIGVRAEIRTHLYNVSAGDRDYFYISESFSDGSGIIFGYRSFGSEHWGWTWGFGLAAAASNLEDGPAGSEGLNETWHTYSITHESDILWTFTLDDAQVAVAPIQLNSPDVPVSLYSEKITYNENGAALGPVEFRNLSYLKADGWHPVSSLRSSAFCLLNGDPNAQCNLGVPYGVSELGPNHVLVGSGMPKHNNGDILWTANPIDSFTRYLLPAALIATLSIVVYLVIRKRVRKIGTPLSRDPGRF